MEESVSFFPHRASAVREFFFMIVCAGTPDMRIFELNTRSSNMSDIHK